MMYNIFETSLIKGVLNTLYLKSKKLIGEL